jgi:hypothetical protein
MNGPTVAVNELAVRLMHFLPAILIVLAFQFLLHATLFAAAAAAHGSELQHTHTHIQTDTHNMRMLSIHE